MVSAGTFRLPVRIGTANAVRAADRAADLRTMENLPETRWVSGLTVSHRAKPGGGNLAGTSSADSGLVLRAVLPGACGPCRTGEPRARGKPLATLKYDLRRVAIDGQTDIATRLEIVEITG